jgi:2-iminobutanoate/2-iminopropanoate deaminase
MVRRLVSYGGVFVLGVVLATLATSVLAAPAAAPAAQQPCLMGPGVRAAPQPGRAIVMPPTLRDSTSSAYSQGVRTGNMLFIAGMTASSAEGGLVGVGDFEAQTRMAFSKIQAVLEAAGGSLDDLTTMTAYLVDLRDAPTFTRLRGEILQRDFPASAIIGTSRLSSQHALLEIQAIAVLSCG